VETTAPMTLEPGPDSWRDIMPPCAAHADLQQPDTPLYYVRGFHRGGMLLCHEDHKKHGLMFWIGNHADPHMPLLLKIENARLELAHPRGLDYALHLVLAEPVTGVEDPAWLVALLLRYYREGQATVTPRDLYRIAWALRAKYPVDVAHAEATT